MSNSDDKSNFLQPFAAENGACVNQSNGIYVRGQRYSFAKKLDAAAVYEFSSSHARQQGKTAKPGSIAKLCRMSKDFVVKIRRELMVHGRVLPLSD